MKLVNPKLDVLVKKTGQRMKEVEKRQKKLLLSLHKKIDDSKIDTVKKKIKNLK